MNYLIRSKAAPADYWSNTLGWTSIDLADQFAAAEQKIFNLPMEGKWVSDYELSADQLRAAYGGNWEQYPKYPVSDWQHEVSEDNTRLGYWEWVAQSIEEDEG